MAAVGFLAFALVPFLEYSATPPAVGSGDTIGERTGLSFGFVAVSSVAAALAWYVAVNADRRGSVVGTAAAALGYVAVMVVAALLFPTVNELGDFPADTLWLFRLSFLFTLTTMWAVLGVVLTTLVVRLHSRHATPAVRDLTPSR